MVRKLKSGKGMARGRLLVSATFKRSPLLRDRKKLNALGFRFKQGFLIQSVRPKDRFESTIKKNAKGITNITIRMRK